MIDIRQARTVKGVCDRRGGVTSTSVYSDARPPWQDAGEQYDGTGWKVTLKFQGRTLTVPFWQGSFHVGDPETSSVLSCVLMDAQCAHGRFTDYCDEMGADEDSRREFATWQECRKMGERLRRLLGTHYDHFTQLETD